MKKDYLFDVASLTKVVCTTTVMLHLQEKKRLFWDDSLKSHLPEFVDPTITLRHLLTHTSDIQMYISNRDRLNQQELIAAYLKLHGGKKIGKTVKYTDAGTILLGFLIEKMYQKKVIDVFQDVVLTPLHMNDSLFLPKAPYDRIVPTEKLANGTILKGITHDPKARVLAEHAGNAGLFSNLKDLNRFVRMYLDQGEISGYPYLQGQTIFNLLKDQTPTKTGGRSIGWDLKYSSLDKQPLLFHTGYTGTFLLIDPIKQSAFVFLSNRVHPKDFRAEYVKHRDEILTVYLNERAKLYHK
ncbi:serine hydrolase [Enterococcus florum]|uniref:Serine hydrolase n=2 Tax=Enterococcus florum TaxID=2480627 RepID=A0A4V0WPV1_9ENTE|nr:serine hydrolase [Enterococcus florum]